MDTNNHAIDRGELYRGADLVTKVLIVAMLAWLAIVVQKIYETPRPTHPIYIDGPRVSQLPVYVKCEEVMTPPSEATPKR
jgi:hypothetical protein